MILSHKASVLKSTVPERSRNDRRFDFEGEPLQAYSKPFKGGRSHSGAHEGVVAAVVCPCISIDVDSEEKLIANR